LCSLRVGALLVFAVTSSACEEPRGSIKTVEVTLEPDPALATPPSLAVGGAIATPATEVASSSTVAPPPPPEPPSESGFDCDGRRRRQSRRSEEESGSLCDPWALELEREWERTSRPR